MTQSAWKRAALAVAVIGAGVAALGALVLLGDEPPRAERSEPGVLVRTVTLEGERARLDIEADGELVPRKQVRLAPEVTGRVVWVSDELRPGAFVTEGQTLARIDRRDYQSALSEAESALADARAALEQERGRREVAKREWALLGTDMGDVDADSRRRALREPQIEAAAARLEAARAQRQRARRNLSRTSLVAPFDAFVTGETADEGMVATAHESVATLVGSRAFWAEVALSVDDLRHIDIPEVNAERGSRARIGHATGDAGTVRHGRVVGLIGELEPQTRMARVLIRVDDPFGLDDSTQRRDQPLLAGAFVHVTIEGNRTEPLVAVPDAAIRSGDEVYVYDGGTLDIRDVDIAWRRDGVAMVRSGVSDGERAVISPIPRPVQGMPLRREADAPVEVSRGAR